MFKKSITLAVSLLAAGAVSAATLVIPTANPVTLTYDSSLLTLLDATPALCPEDPAAPCWQARFTPVNPIATGNVVAEFEISAATPMNLTQLVGGLSFMKPAAPADVQLRFSYSTYSWKGTVTDLDTGATIFDTESALGYLNLPSGFASRVGVTLEYDFAPGHWLRPSADPSCAALSCMVAGSDTSTMVLATIGVVPEPSTYLLMAGGLLALSRLRKRRVD